MIQLKRLAISGNPVIFPPKQVTDQGTRSILCFLKNRHALCASVKQTNYVRSITKDTTNLSKSSLNKFGMKLSPGTSCFDKTFGLKFQVVPASTNQKENNSEELKLSFGLKPQHKIRERSFGLKPNKLNKNTLADLNSLKLSKFEMDNLNVDDCSNDSGVGTSRSIEIFPRKLSSEIKVQSNVLNNRRKKSRHLIVSEEMMNFYKRIFTAHTNIGMNNRIGHSQRNKRPINLVLKEELDKRLLLGCLTSSNVNKNKTYIKSIPRISYTGLIKSGTLDYPSTSFENNFHDQKGSINSRKLSPNKTMTNSRRKDFSNPDQDHQLSPAYHNAIFNITEKQLKPQWIRKCPIPNDVLSEAEEGGIGGLPVFSHVALENRSPNDRKKSLHLMLGAEDEADYKSESDDSLDGDIGEGCRKPMQEATDFLPNGKKQVI